MKNPNQRKNLFFFFAGSVFILAGFAFCLSSAYSQSATTAFKVTINNNDEYTSSRQVTLTLKAGSDTKIMVLSNTSDFTYSIIGTYQSTKQWTLSDGEGTKTVYAKFCTQDSCSSKVFSDSIIYKKPISSVPSVPNEPSSCLDLSFDKNLYLGMSNKDVQCLKILLNKDPGTILSATGQGSAGRETTYFGPLTEDAVIRFQNKYKTEISAVVGYTIQATGFVGKGTRAKLNALSEETPPETPPETPAPPVSVLSTNLQASINSSNWQDNLTGTAPLTGVDLKADVTGTATGSISYSFDCQGDGTWESPDDTQYKGITSVTKEFTDGCSYLIPGTWTARVKVERGTDSPVYDTVPITVSQLAIGGCGDGTCNGTETCSTCPGDCGSCAAVCGDGSCNGIETCSTCPGDCGSCNTNNNFIFTFWWMYIGDGYYNSTLIDLMDKMMATGMTYAGVYIRPATISDESMLDLKSKGYKIALGISAGHYTWGGGPEELINGTDDSKFLNAPCLNRSKCENWNKPYAIDPSYTGILWQNTLDNTYNVTKTINPDLVLFDTEIWNDPLNVEYYFNNGDPGNNCNCKIVEQGIGYDAYLSNWKERGIELKNAVKRATPSALTSFYGEIPENSKSWSQKYNGDYSFRSIGYMLNGTGDFSSPSLYILPNLEVLEKNTQDMNLSNSAPWVSFTYFNGYSGYGGGNVYFDPSVSREAGRMLRKAGAKGFIVYPNAASFNEGDYWINHSREMIQGFNEGLTYVEKNKIQNPDFEAFKTITGSYSYHSDGSIYLIGQTQFAPVYWSWTDSNPSYKNVDANAANLVSDKESGMYAWKHSRTGDVGSRTISSNNFTIGSGDGGDYNFSIWDKTNIDSGDGKLKFYIINLTNSEQKIGEINFQSSWNKFEGKINLIEGNYKLKILIEDSTGQKIDVLFDDVDLEKIVI